jgi:uncharacterized protein (TIGR03083 family)
MTADAQDPELEGLDPFDLMDAECARIDEFFASTSDDELAAPSRCAGWSKRDLLAHLDSVEDYNRACLDGRVQALFAEASGKVDSMDAWNDHEVDARRGQDTPSLLAHWRAANAAFRAEMRKRGSDGTLDSSIGPYPVGLQGFHLAAEYAVHADDAGVPAPDGAERTAWLARVARFAIAEAKKPARVTASGGSNRVRVGDEEHDVSDPDLVLAAAARLPADHPLPQDARDALRAFA